MSPIYVFKLFIILSHIYKINTINTNILPDLFLTGYAGNSVKKYLINYLLKL